MLVQKCWKKKRFIFSILSVNDFDTDATHVKHDKMTSWWRHVTHDPILAYSGSQLKNDPIGCYTQRVNSEVNDLGIKVGGQIEFFSIKWKWTVLSSIVDGSKKTLRLTLRPCNFWWTVHFSYIVHSDDRQFNPYGPIPRLWGSILWKLFSSVLIGGYKNP